MTSDMSNISTTHEPEILKLLITLITNSWRPDSSGSPNTWPGTSSNHTAWSARGSINQPSGLQQSKAAEPANVGREYPALPRLFFKPCSLDQ